MSTGEPIPPRHAPPYTAGLPAAEEILSHLQQGGLWHCRLTDEHGRSCVGIAQLYVNEQGCIKMRRPAWWPLWMSEEKKLLPEVIQVRPCAEDLTPLPSVGDEPEYREGLPSVALARAHARPVEKPTGSHGVIVATRGLWHCQAVRTEDGVVVASGIISMSASGQLKQAKWGHEVPGFYGRFVLRMVSGAIMVRTRPCEEDLTPVPWP